MKRAIRIGSRDSDLALWQANTVKNLLDEEGIGSEIIKIKSEGDLTTNIPLYELGITGIFTRTLDIALLNKEVDIAVHSMKDVPTALPKRITQAAVLRRANPRDILVHKGLDFLNTEGILATGSLRRKSQWLNRYPLHEVVDLRGNVPTRLNKLSDQPWNAAIFAAAGLERLGIVPENSTELQWMVPAPAQGAIMVVAREDDKESLKRVSALNDKNSEICTLIEREFLRELEGGCSAPIGALAEIKDQTVKFSGLLASLDGQELIRLERETRIKESDGFGISCARELLDMGGVYIMKEIKAKQIK